MVRVPTNNFHCKDWLAFLVIYVLHESPKFNKYSILHAIEDKGSELAVFIEFYVIQLAVMII